MSVIVIVVEFLGGAESGVNSVEYIFMGVFMPPKPRYKVVGMVVRCIQQCGYSGGFLYGVRYQLSTGGMC